VRKPVIFHYKSDNTKTPQVGLIAEEVAQINPDLVVRNKEGQILAVRYDAINVMLLNEFLKEHKQFKEQQAIMTKMRSIIASQQKQLKSAIEQFKPQAASDRSGERSH